MALPAPYAPPWKRLGEDLVATLAWLRLKARELWRRNWEGNLPVPRFWPRQWPQLFWPLVGGGVLLAALALSWPWLVRETSGRESAPPVQSKPNPPTASSPAASEPSPTPQPSAETLEAGALGPGQQNGPVSSPELETGNPEPVAEAQVLEEDSPVAADLDATAVDIPTEADLLRAEWGAEDPEHLIEARTAELASSTLTLQLNTPFLALPLATRQRWAERWQQRAESLGYSHLCLMDGKGKVLGRDAQVGSGMILFHSADGRETSR